ncbi:MAG: AbrB/MazE/SpoVT family DNA-binding domain-containing protein [Blastocatellia bacterium]|nr:AbrB/MazE/SpoVT family DNA-binding domain-containing protein [Blastocatellia bacterium]
MRVQIQKWGNSLALRIPKSFANESNIEQGSLVDLSVIEGKLIVVPVSEPEYTLDELLAGVTKENIHPEY